jgi:hypothetical protein
MAKVEDITLVTVAHKSGKVEVYLAERNAIGMAQRVTTKTKETLGEQTYLYLTLLERDGDGSAATD